VTANRVKIDDGYLMGLGIMLASAEAEVVEAQYDVDTGKKMDADFHKKALARAIDIRAKLQERIDQTWGKT